MCFGIVQFSVNFDRERSLTASSIQLADQRNIYLVATDDCVEIKIDIPVQVHFAVSQ